MRPGIFGWFGQWSDGSGGGSATEEPFPLDGSATVTARVGGSAAGGIRLRGSAQREDR